MKIGYARVSTDEQSLDLQRDALTAWGCERICVDEGVSGATVRRPGLDEALALVQPGGVLVVWKLDRLGRSLSHLIEIVRILGERGVGFTSLSDSFDTTTPGGTLIFHVMGALAEYERALIRSRIMAGIASAKKRGKHLGRKPKLTPEQIAHAREVIDKGLETPAGMAQLLNVDHSTLWRAFRAADRNRLHAPAAPFSNVPLSEGGTHGH